MPKALRIVALVNAAGGTTQRHSETDLREQLGTIFLKYGISAEVELISPSELSERARLALSRAMRNDIDAVVAGGGDGSIRAVAEVLAGSRVPLGVLPLGTLNHFAKDLGLPVDLDGAIGIIAAGQTNTIDIAEVNGHAFLNNSSIGIYPYMVLDRERRRRKSGLGKRLAMLLAALRTLRYLPIRRMWLGVDGRTRVCRTPCLFVGNNPYDLGPPSLGKRDCMDTGVLWLCVAKPKTRLSLLWLAAKGLFGFVSPMTDVEILTVTTMDVSVRSSRIAVAIDGEVEILRPPLHYRTRPKGLLVYAPAAPS